jgi:cellulose synthase/poly-beta-1,6-N-acetylglucosamine synthase-like glycosyltransferase
VYGGYPLLLVLLRLFVRRPVEKQPVEPSVSLLIAAYNEAASIAAKLRNSLEVDYPANRLEIVVASDGSTDGTAEIASRVADGKRIRLVCYPGRRGKLAVLNDTVPCLQGEIVAFSDATSMLAPDALRRLVESFADPDVGAVSGAYRVECEGETSPAAAEGFYWRYEAFLKEQEALLDSTVGAHGSLYAIRRALYPFPDEATVNDDFVIPIRVLQRGYRVVYERRAMAREPAGEMGGFGRRVRLMTGNFQQVGELRRLVWPARPLPLLFFLCHKVGRLMVPFWLVALVTSNVMLLRQRLYRWLFSAQVLFYGLAALGAVCRLRPRWLQVPYYFCMVNAAALAALLRRTRGSRDLAWKREEPRSIRGRTVDPGE